VIDAADPAALAGFWCGLLAVKPGPQGFQWRCMADPEGNEFDIDVLPSP
jgi:hypothetical protein